MGAIMAIERDGVVYMAADSVKCSSGVVSHMNKLTNQRIHKMPSGVLLAACGPVGAVQRLWLRDDWFRPAKGETFDKRYIVTQIIPKFYREISRFNFESSSSADLFIKEYEVGFILAKGPDIYTIRPDLSVLKCDGLVAVDDGGGLNKGMMTYARNCSDRDPETVLRKTFAAVSRQNNNVSHCHCVVNDRDFQFKIGEVTV